MIYIVIPVFNRRQFTERCLRSLRIQTVKLYKVIVVDHGSTDGTSEMIETDFPEVILLKGDESMWWAAATNMGITKILEVTSSDEDLILTLNNDLVVNENYLEELLKVYSLQKLCLVGSVSVDINDFEKIHYAGIKWNRFSSKYEKAINSYYSHSALINKFKYIYTDLLPGRGTLIPMKLFREIGLFDDINFPHYSADEDFSLRAKKIGYQLLVAPKAVVKSHIYETGLNVNSKISFSTFLSSLSSLRSANNMIIRYRWAKKHGAIPAIYFFCDMIRVFGSYFRSLVRSNA